MVYGRYNQLVNGGYFMVYKPTFTITGGPHPVCLLGPLGLLIWPERLISVDINFWSLKLCIHSNGNFRNRLIGGTYHICKGISSQNMAWKMVQYLHFRILEFPLIHMLTAGASIDGVDDCCRRTLVCPTCRRSPKTSWLRTVERMLFSSKTSITQLRHLKKETSITLVFHGIHIFQQHVWKTTPEIQRVEIFQVFTKICTQNMETNPMPWS